jgi:hypothetical protein
MDFRIFVPDGDPEGVRLIYQTALQRVSMTQNITPKRAGGLVKCRQKAGCS